MKLILKAKINKLSRLRKIKKLKKILIYQKIMFKNIKKYTKMIILKFVIKFKNKINNNKQYKILISR